MKFLPWLALLLPVAALAQPLNPTNNPNQPGYQIPSQQRLSQEMSNQQAIQKNTLRLQQQQQQQQQSQKLQQQIQQQQQRTQQLQPGSSRP